MPKIFAILIMIFAIFTFVGAGYVLSTHGCASPGYAIIPMLFCLICAMKYQSLKKTK